MTDARELANRELWLPVTTSTFHGRDIFAPMAAHLACADADFDDVGPAIDSGDLVPLDLPEAAVEAGRHLETVVTYVDSFGNLRLAGDAGTLTSALGELADGAALTAQVDAATLETVTFAPSFGHVAEGATLLYVDSTGDLALADNQGNLAARIAASRGSAVRLERGD